MAHSFMRRYLKDKDGATAIEYSLIAVGVSLSVLWVAFAFGETLVSLYNALLPALERLRV